MPRYFFNLSDGYSLPDTEGVVLSGIDEAKASAVIFSGEMLRDLGAKFWNTSGWKLELADERGRVLFVLRFSAETFAPEQ